MVALFIIHHIMIFAIKDSPLIDFYGRDRLAAHKNFHLNTDSAIPSKMIVVNSRAVFWGMINISRISRYCEAQVFTS